jgi:uncharacterized OsmC-like protein
VSEPTEAGSGPSLDEVIRSGVRAREAADRRTGLRGLYRIDIRVVEGLAYEARNPLEPDAIMRIDEPVDRGGSGHGASPLSHFLSGVGACLLNQFIRLAVADDVPVTFAGAAVRGEFGRESGGTFERIVCVIRGVGDLPDDAAERLVERAERLCYVHCTLSRVVEMTTVLELDGRERVRRVVGPARG